MKFKKVAVVMGGVSNEREVSLRSGRAICRALRGEGVDAVEVVMDDMASLKLAPGTEAVWLALHGGAGENGEVQQALDATGMPYTGSGAAASRLAMDKIASKKCFEEHGIPTAPWQVVTPATMAPDTGFAARINLPVVVKPPREGSSVGISCVREAASLPEAVAAAAKLDARGEALVEAYVPGREWAVGVLGGGALPPVEILAADGWYDYDAKYDPSRGTQYVFPEGDAALAARCQALAVDVFHALGCRGFGRVDFRITPEGAPFVLEMNTLPGFTATSLFPKAAARAGMSFGEVCVKILELAAYDGAGFDKRG